MTKLTLEVSKGITHAQDRQKSYTNENCKDLEFNVMTKYSLELSIISM